MRDNRSTKAYWDEWILFSEERICKVQKIRESSSPKNTSYESQYVRDLAWRYLRLMLQKYSRGDAVGDFGQYFLGFLDAWEESEQIGKQVWGEEEQFRRHAWGVNLDHYIDCFWLTGLALALDISDELWRRLLALMGNEGEDALLDRVIASRQPGRTIGNKLCFPDVYRPLLVAIDAPADQQPQLLRKFVENWFVRLKGAGHPSFPSAHRTPYWYFYGDKNLEGGAYFGRWCIEAVAAAKAFGIDDRLCLDHPNYPGDLLQDGRSPRYPDAMPVANEAVVPSRPVSGASWLRRLLGRS